MADFITASSLKGLIKLSESAMPDSCTIFRRTETVVGRGRKQGKVQRGPAVKCRVTPSQNQFDRVGNAPGSEAEYTVTVPLGTVVEDGDFVTIVSRSTGTKDLEVSRVYEPQSYAVDISFGADLDKPGS